MKLGYARKSTTDQRFDRQLELLNEHGAERIFQDVSSGGKRNRAELNRMLSQLRRDDLVVVVTLDRFRERVREGVTAAKMKGRIGGRPSALTVEQKQAVRDARLLQNKSISECSRLFGVNRRTISPVSLDEINN